MDAGLNFSIIAAVAENGVIGRDGAVPWRLKSDLARFSELTRGHTVIMGRKTLYSILELLGHPLRGRVNIVLSRQVDYLSVWRGQGHNTVYIVNSWESALDLASKQPTKKVFAIGGEEIYRLALPCANYMYITCVHAVVSGDAFFPKYDRKEWLTVLSEYHNKDARNEHGYTYEVLIRRSLLNIPEPEEKERFVSLDSVRTEEQLEVMKRIEEQGFCPFCPENYSRAELMPIIKQGEYWHARENRWPYENTRTHLLIIHNIHKEKLSQLSEGAISELFSLAQLAENEYGVKGGGLAIGMRFGDPRYNAGSVNHLHAHFMEVNVTDRNDPNYIPLRLRLG